MSGTYKIHWTPQALDDLDSIISYLEEFWTEKEIKSFAKALDVRLSHIAQNPNLYPQIPERRGVHRAVIHRLTSLFYRVKDHQIELLSLFDNRQDPKKRKY